VQQNAAFTSISGAVYNTQDKTIGRGVRVPHAYYKIVINQKTGELAGWYFPHTAPYPNLGNDLTKFRRSLSQIQSDAGVQFKFPPNARELSPGQEWPVDFGALTNQKRKLCGSNAGLN
jgi:DNA/RNA endonuclease G (NUC1)